MSALVISGQLVLLPGQLVLLPGPLVLLPGQLVLLPGQLVILPGQLVLPPGQLFFLPGQSLLLLLVHPKGPGLDPGQILGAQLASPRGMVSNHLQCPLMQLMQCTKGSTQYSVLYSTSLQGCTVLHFLPVSVSSAAASSWAPWPGQRGTGCRACTGRIQLSAVSCQSSAVSCQLPVVSCKSSAVSCQLPVTSCQLSDVNCQLSVVSC